MAKYIIKIDHHIYKESYGDIAIVDTEYESCAGLVADIIFKMKLKMTESAAKALYTGIVTDSGRFRYESTTSRTFLTAAKLLETKPEDAIVFEDSVAGIQAANIGNMTSIGIGEAAILHEAKYIFRDFTEIDTRFIADLIKE